MVHGIKIHFTLYDRGMCLVSGKILQLMGSRNEGDCTVLM